MPRRKRRRTRKAEEESGVEVEMVLQDVYSAIPRKRRSLGCMSRSENSLSRRKANRWNSARTCKYSRRSNKTSQTTFILSSEASFESHWDCLTAVSARHCSPTHSMSSTTSSRQRRITGTVPRERSDERTLSALNTRDSFSNDDLMEVAVLSQREVDQLMDDDRRKKWKGRVTTSIAVTADKLRRSSRIMKE